jgi:2-phosphoglycerate kinase
MKPKLILINGPLGIGKSTITRLYADEHPLTLMLDIDGVWSMISHWREQKDASAPLSKEMALALASINLRAQHDVVIPQILQTKELVDRFIALAEEYNADFYEILLIVDKEDAIDRFIQRGKANGNPSGFRTGGIIDTSGREKKLAEMYDNMLEVAASRQHVIKIRPILDDINGTYSEIIKAIG